MKLKLKRILYSSWLLCGFITVLILMGMLFEFYPMQFLEYKTYDMLATLRQRKDINPIVIIGIDDKSIENIGNWPWPRSYIADMIRRLSQYHPKVLGIHLLFSGRELNPGLEEIGEVRKAVHQDSFLKNRKKTRYRINRILNESEKKLNHDASLIAAVNRAVNAVLPIRFTEGDGDQSDKAKMPVWLVRQSIKSQPGTSKAATKSGQARAAGTQTNNDAISAATVISTFGALAVRAGALGHTNVVVDRDGSVRRVPLIIGHQGRYFPSFSLQAAAKYMDGSVDDIKPADGKLNFKTLEIPTDGDYRMFVDFDGRQSDFESFSFYDVFNGDIAPDRFRGKIVLLGVTAPWLTPFYKTTVGQGLSEIEITAHALENIVNRKYLSRPAWAYVLEILVILYFGLFLVFVIPRVRPRDGAFILGIFVVTWMVFAVVLFMTFGYWLKIFAPLFLALLGYMFAGYKRFSVEKQAQSTELNKMLGQSFQSKGMLDMAYEKFLQCPVEDGTVRELLYNLGQDFERKRMFNKALAVYHHMMKAGNYRDINKRIQTLKNLGETGIFTAAPSKRDDSLILDEATTKPTLGRYEVLKELGQGAMGVVYLGKDPRINREVAIKTLKYSDVDPHKLPEVKKRFFREAEAAGKLSHPNIMTIYDVGEDYDMAYMAIELLKGQDLADYCEKDKLLPVKKVLTIGAAVAEALDYAHNQGVVHRDIKPDNILLLENDEVKVADFGIARVMSASTTETGMILGTPNYMSPEQVAGEKVDGRSDIFSLGVVLYELFSGEKPFKGDNLTNLMYAIANVNYIPLKEVVRKTPSCCSEVVDKLLTKSVRRRPKSAAIVVDLIRDCLSKIK
ncbi:MAG: serine/threonine-protein kinase [Desulfobacterales bacterium]|jgi:serine/threonine-protein kinase